MLLQYMSHELISGEFMLAWDSKTPIKAFLGSFFYGNVYGEAVSLQLPISMVVIMGWHLQCVDSVCHVKCGLL